MMEIIIKNVTLMEETVVYPMWKTHIALIVNARNLKKVWNKITLEFSTTF